MAEASGARTEEPTPRRLREARGRGQVATSADLTAGLLLLIGGTTVLLTAERTVRILSANLVDHLARALDDTPLTVASASELLRDAAASALAVLGPLLAVLFLGAALVVFLQVGPLFSTRAVEPRFERLEPSAGFRGRFLSLDATARGGRALLVMVLALGIVALLARDSLREIALTMRTPPAQSREFVADLLRALVLRVGFALVALGAVDLLFQRWRHLHALRMTKEEVRREQRQEEGDPHHKGQRLRRHREILGHEARD